MSSSAAHELKNQEILVIDGQATTSRPETGFLFEMGWAAVRASQVNDVARLDSRIQTFLLSPPLRCTLPPQVQKISGIQTEDLKSAHSLQSIWELVQEEAQRIAVDSDLWPCPVVIHFARYETPFLSQMHALFGTGSAFPLNIVCTHQIVQRLIPGLPRKGLRAVSGFFGYALPELRRCRHHVQATALIWKHLVEKLASEHDITSLAELQIWLDQPISFLPHPKGRRIYPMDQRLRKDLPDGPGLYRMYRLSGDILYVGKAKSLKQRVNSYFRPQSRHSEHILEMLSQAKDLTYTPTQSALEAAVRESDEIKRLHPPFNRALQDNGRELSYFSSDLKLFSSRYHPVRFPLGPFTSTRHILPLRSLMDLLNGDFRRVSSRSIQEILDLPVEYLPERAVFKQGVRDLQQEYPILASDVVDTPALRSLGARLWRERLIAILQESEDPELETETEETEKNDPGIWTRERVTRVIKSQIRSGTHQIRRAGWFLRLSESQLVWPTGCDAEKKYTAVVHEARVTFPDLSTDVSDRPIHPGEGEDPDPRHVNFDTAAYDRMRVLTTEIRRLVQEGRNVELNLVPHVLLSTARLLRLLPWV